MAEDRKFKFEDGHFVNRVSGEVVPDNEPVFILRARDRWSLNVLTYYLNCVNDPHHKKAVAETLKDFEMYRKAHPDRVKEPGITKDFKLRGDD